MFYSTRLIRRRNTFKAKSKRENTKKKTPSGISETEIRLFEEKNQNKSSNK
jgi:hypothetical protein